MFEDEVVIPITDIFRVEISSIRKFGYEGIYIYNNKNNKIIYLRHTQSGYGLFKQRVLAVLPPGAITTYVPQKS